MKVIQDNQIYLYQRYGGVSRYFVELNSALRNLNDDNYYDILAPIHFNAHLKQKKDNGLYLPFSSNKFNINQYIRNTSDYLSRKKIRNLKPDLIHETFYRNDDPWVKSIPRVTTIHDLIREKYSQHQKKIERKLNSINRSESIVCVSHNTKNDLLEYYPFLKHKKIYVVYVGVNKSIFYDSSSFKKENKILYVGHRDGYKNFSVLLKAFKISKNLKNHFQLIAIGGGKFTSQEKEIITSYGINKNIFHVEGNDSYLADLYRKCISMVYTSKYEGFGSPILESMSSGCVVFANNTPALKEAGGDAAIYFNTESAEDLADTLEKYLNDSEKMRKFRSDGIKRSTEFSWEKTALETKQIYKDIIS